MTFEELLNDDIFQLPSNQKKKEDFKTFITGKLNSFMEKVNSLENGPIHPLKRYINTDFVKEVQKIITGSLIQCINEYYNGKPADAYTKFSLVLKNQVKDLHEILNIKKYKPNESFFRMRLSDTNRPYTKREMFHIPFELRNKVTTQRFSIPGFPSLYLGRTVYICWEELGRPNIDKVQAIRLQNDSSIKLLDLTPPEKDCHDINELYRFFMTFPLIMCCSVKVKDTTDTFKPEYIIPQILLQWIRNNDNLDGIQYKSTHISATAYKENSELINIVIPVKTNSDKGICQELARCFKSTNVISWNLRQLAKGGADFGYMPNEFAFIDNRIPNLEIIEGEKSPYSQSILGRMEYYLEKMNLEKIS